MKKAILSSLLIFAFVCAGYAQSKELKRKYNFAVENEYRFELNYTLKGEPDDETIKNAGTSFANGAFDFYEVMREDKNGYFDRAPYYYIITLALSLYKDDYWFTNRKDELDAILAKVKAKNYTAEIAAAEAVFKSKAGDIESAEQLNIDAKNFPLSDSVAFKYLQKLSGQFIFAAKYDRLLKKIYTFEDSANNDSLIWYADKLLSLKPNDFAALYTKMLANYQMEKYQDAIRLAMQANDAKRNENAFHCIALCYQNMNNIDSAIYFAHIAFDMNPNDKFRTYLSQLNTAKMKDSNPEMYAILEPMVENNDYSNIAAFLKRYPVWSNSVSHTYNYAGTTPYTIDREIDFAPKDGSINANLFSLVTIETNSATELGKWEHVKFYLANDYTATVSNYSNNISFDNKQAYFEFAGFNGYKTAFYRDDPGVMDVVIKKKCDCSQPENISTEINNVATAIGFGTATLNLTDPSNPYLDIDGEHFYPGAAGVDKSEYINIDANTNAAELSSVLNYVYDPNGSSSTGTSVCPKCHGTGFIDKYGSHLAYVDYTDSQGRKIYSNLEKVEGSYRERCNKCNGTGRAQ